MIKYTDNADFIIKLWQQAFGDTTEDILFFINNVKDADCLMYFCDGKPASMMYLVDCCIDGEKRRYIYAACTAKEYRGRGFMSQLIDHCLSKGVKVCLIPADDSLIDFYSKRKINKKISIESIEFAQIPEIEEYLFEGYSLTEPCGLMS